MREHRTGKLYLWSLWLAIAIQTIVFVYNKEQLVSIFLWVGIGVLLNVMFLLKEKETISKDIRKAIKFTFEFGVFSLWFQAIKEVVGFLIVNG